MRVRAVLLLSAVLSLTGCAAAGVIAEPDPMRKLDLASVLIYEQNRPAPAERLIYESIASFTTQKDAHGLANSYVTYAEFLKSRSVALHESQYRKAGFRDSSVNFDNRLDKSQGYPRPDWPYGSRVAHAGWPPNGTSWGRCWRAWRLSWPWSNAG